ncbi:MAG: hypothetical protein HY735_28740 [Verrucomicrobia bacterium]|nr:hypothetical protein [Verrucomicrobiota bacterium]
MQRLISFLRFEFASVALMLLTLGWVGCATSKIDWNTRVGSYTYDQAVLELGPAEKSETLKDGTKVAEWMTSRGYASGTMTSLGGHYYGSPWIHYYSEQPSPDYFLRLTFSPDGVLRAWRRVQR